MRPRAPSLAIGLATGPTSPLVPMVAACALLSACDKPRTERVSEEQPAAAPAVGRVIDALPAARGVVEARPQDAAAWRELGDLYFEVGDYDAGQQAYLNASQFGGSAAADFLRLAHRYAEVSLLGEAAAHARRALELDPEIDGAHAIIARQSLATQNFEELSSLLKGRWPEPEQMPATERRLLGRALVALGEFAAGADLLGASLGAPGPAAPPDDILAEHLSLAEAQLGRGDFPGAGRAAAAALILDPHSARGYFLLGSALARGGQGELAEAMLGNYRALAPLATRREKIDEMQRTGLRNRANYEHARLLADTREFAAALDAAQRAAQLGGAEQGMVSLGAASVLADMFASAEARRVLEAAIAFGDEPRADLLANLGELGRKAGAHEGARQHFDAALEIDPNHLVASIGRGQCQFEAGDLAGAEADFQRAQTAAPENWRAYHGLAEIAHANGEDTLARSLLGKVESVGGARPASLELAGRILLAGGNGQGAARRFLEALQHDPQSAAAAQGLESAMELLGDAARTATARERREVTAGFAEAQRQLRRGSKPFSERGADFARVADYCRQLNSPQGELRFLYLAANAAPRQLETWQRIAAIHAGDNQSLFFRARALKTVVALEPADTAAQAELAQLLARISPAAAQDEPTPE